MLLRYHSTTEACLQSHKLQLPCCQAASDGVSGTAPFCGLKILQHCTQKQCVVTSTNAPAALLQCPSGQSGFAW